MYKIFYPTAAEYIFFSSAPVAFSRIDYMLGHKTRLSKYKTEIIPSIFSNHNGMKLEISNRRKTEKFTEEKKYVEIK